MINNVNPKLYETKNAKMYRSYTGVLDLHWETGYEDGMLAHVYVDKFDQKNPNYNPQDQKSGPPIYRSYEGIVSLDIKDILEITDCPALPEFNGTKFLLGNMDMARKDKFCFGRAYPINVDKNFSLEKWRKIFSAGTTKATVQKLMKKVCLYGGTFDPFHNGHLEIISQLRHTFDEVIVLVNNNWTKNNKPLFSLDERINSVKAVSERFLNVSVLEWAKTEDTSSTYEVTNKLKNQYGICPFVVVGADNLNQIEKWKYSEKLVAEFPFVICKREGYTLDTSIISKHKMNYILIDKIPKMSSSEIRESHNDTNIPEEVKKALDLSKLK